MHDVGKLNRKCVLHVLCNFTTLKKTVNIKINNIKFCVGTKLLFITNSQTCRFVEKIWSHFWTENQREHHIILTKYDAVPPMDVSKNNLSPGMLIILTKTRTVCISSNRFASKLTLYCIQKDQISNVIPK